MVVDLSTMTPDRIMIRARTRIINRESFFATLILKLKLVPEESGTPMMATDGISLFYNPAYILKQKFKIIMTDICHESLHCALCHHIRRGKRDPHKWNIACDYAVNAILKAFGLEMDDTFLYEKRFEGMTAEKIYKIIDKEMSNDEAKKKQCCGGIREPKQEGDGKNGDGEKDDSKEGESGSGQTPLTPSEIATIEFEAKMDMKDALMASKKAGTLPGSLKQMFEDFSEPKIPWQNILRQFLEVHTKNDYCWTRPNRKYISLGIILPSLHSLDLGTLVVLTDVSSSVDNVLLKEFFNELSGMLAYVNLDKIILILVDIKVQKVMELTKADLPLKIDVIGRGGTDFRPGFNHIIENGIKPSCIIYFTDMECMSFPDAPEAKVLWCTKTKEKAYMNPPFGHVLQIE